MQHPAPRKGKSARPPKEIDIKAFFRLYEKLETLQKELLEKYQKNTNRLTALENQINGNGSIGMREQLEELRKAVKELNRIFRFSLGILLMLSGEKIYEYIRYIIHAL